MKPNKRKAVVSDPIKRIELNGGNGAREIVIQIARALGFKIHENEKGVSSYGGNAIRLADHCTYMQTWVDNGTWNAPVRLDIVVEDEPTQAVTQVKDGYDFTITEFVLPSNTMSPQTARMIAYDIRNTMNGKSYANNARGEKRLLKSTHNTDGSQQSTQIATKQNIISNKQYTNMKTENKNVVRLTESQLRGIIREAVKSALNESPYQDNGLKINKVLTSKNGTYHFCVNIEMEKKSENEMVGGFEYYVKEDEENTYLEGYLYIVDNEVEDFDGCYDLPKAVKKVLNDEGYVTNW